MGNDPDDDGNEEPQSRAGSQWRGDEVGYFWHDIHEPANRPPPPTVKQLVEKMLLRLGFSQLVARKLVDDKGTLASLSDENIANICDLIQRPGGIDF